MLFLYHDYAFAGPTTSERFKNFGGKPEADVVVIITCPACRKHPGLSFFTAGKDGLTEPHKLLCPGFDSLPRYHLPMKQRSPIEKMIDDACGFKPENFIRLECPICRSSLLSERMPLDPPNAVKQSFPCPKCLTSASTPSGASLTPNEVIKFYDSDDQLINPTP